MVIAGVRLEVLLSYFRQRHAHQLPGRRGRHHRPAMTTVKRSGRDGFYVVTCSFSASWPRCTSRGSCWTCSWCSGSAWRGARGSPIGSPGTGSTARPTTGPASSTTRSTTPTSASRTTSTSSPPTTGRFPTFRRTTRRTRCCSARSTRSLSMISFTAILWNLSGPLTLPIIGYELPRAMFWIGIVFVLFASVIAFWIGRPIIWLSFNNEKYNAAFRYALVRLRDASEAVAFYRGEVAERTGLRKLFAPVVSNYKRYVNRSIGFNGWNWSMGQAIVPLPYLLQFPRFYSGEITARRHEPDRIGVRPDPGRAVVLPQRLRLVRRLPGRDHPARGSGHRQRGRQGAAGDHDHALCRRHGPARRHRGPHARRKATHQARSTCDWKSATRWWSPASRVREDHAAAQPGRVVAVHVRHADAAVRAERDDVPVPAALCAAGRPARRRELPERGRRHRRRNAKRIWRKWHCHTSSPGSKRYRTGPRCSPPANNSGSRSPACC